MLTLLVSAPIPEVVAHTRILRADGRIRGLPWG
jgi:hypothetical protein